MSGATISMMTQDVGAHHMLAPQGSDGMATSMPTIQPVFISRQHHVSSQGQQLPPGSPPGSLAASASADWAYLLRTAALTASAGPPTMDVGMAGSSPSNLQDYLSMRSSPQIHSSPSLLYSPVGSTAPNNSNFFNSMCGDLSPDGMGSGDPNSLVMQLSNGNNLASSLSAAAAAAVYGDPNGVQTLYSSTDQLAMAAGASAAAAVAARQAQQTQTLLQQQAAAVNSLSNGLGGMGLSAGLAKLEDSMSGSLFGAGAGSGSGKPVSSSLYIKNLPADADKLFLYEKFSPYGAILSVKVLNDPQSGQCRGVGFVNFAEHSSAMRSIQALHGTKVGDKLMHVSLQTPRIRASALQMQ